MTPENEGVAEPRGKGSQPKLILGGLFGLLALLFAVVNFDEVKVNWIVGSAQTPLIIVIAVSFVLGAAVGAATMRRSR